MSEELKPVTTIEALYAKNEALKKEFEQFGAEISEELVKRFSKLEFVEAVLFYQEGCEVCVFVIVPEHDREYVGEVLDVEDEIRRLYPGLVFDFHTYASQGRDPRRISISEDLELVYLRNKRSVPKED